MEQSPRAFDISFGLSDADWEAFLEESAKSVTPEQIAAHNAWLASLEEARRALRAARQAAALLNKPRVHLT